MLERISHYRIVSELGRGGMGVVYKAHEESLNRFVAIKVLGEHLEEDTEYVERFLREAQSAAQLNHPNIVQIYAVSEEEGRHYFVMEYVSGRSLQEILRADGPMAPPRAAQIMLQTAAGLHAAHEQGIVHRDIKPANLMIDDRGLVKIADFGLALMGGAATRLTATGMLMGTPGYLSPEQCMDQKIDLRTDIYSLGVSFFEALTGKIPFSADSPLALLRQIVELEAPDLSELNPEIDEALVKMVARMMAKDREERYPDCGELVNDLQQYLEKSGVSAGLVEGMTTPAPRRAEQPGAAASGRDTQLDSQPTRRVETAPSEAPQQPPPPPPPAAAVKTEVPVVETSPVTQEPPPSGGRRLALVVALVVVLGLATVLAAGVFAWKRGLFNMALKGGTETVQTQSVADEAGPSESAAAGAPAEEEAEEVTAGGTTTGQPALPTAQPTATAPVVGPPTTGSAYSGKRANRRQPERNVPPPRPTLVPPMPEGTVVIALGEQLFAGEAEVVVEEALSRAGIPLVDENGLPGVAQLLGVESPLPGQLHAALRPYVRNAVLVRVEYLGERPLQYMGQPDIAFQARVTIAPVDVQTGRSLASPKRFRVEYTQLSATRVAEEKLRRPSRWLVDLLQ
ncbi:MAG: serine/threonine-protein kinase [Thermoanaerobaculales bacterium]